MENMIQTFLDKHHLRGRVLPATRLKNLNEEFDRVLKKGLVSSKVADVYLKNFSFTKPEGLKSLNSIMVFSMPRSAHSLGINYKGEKIRVILPPTYVDYQKVNKKVFSLFKKWTASRGNSVYVARLPLKLLSVRSGLAIYGKNNISYIGDWGSFHQLFAFYSDMETDSDPWQKNEVLDACRTCRLCLKNCPTGAIRGDRFLLESARCLTLLNESEEDMPDWVEPGAHNSLIGCMRCQTVCPYNSKVKDLVVDIGELDERETEMLLCFNKERDKGSPIIARSKELGIYEFFAGLIPRNLKLLLKTF